MKLSLSRTSIIVTALISACVLTAGLASAKEGRDGKGRGHGMFERMDVNKDGKITKTESAQVAAEHFKKIDANGDGAVTKEELQAAHEARRAKHAEKRAHDDADPPKRDGESKKGQRGHGPERFFAKLDTNNDGKVTRAEAQQAQIARFTKVDSNKDGAITKEEAQAAHKAHKAHKKGGDHTGKQACDGEKDKDSKEESVRNSTPA